MKHLLFLLIQYYYNKNLFYKIEDIRSDDISSNNNLEKDNNSDEFKILK